MKDANNGSLSDADETIHSADGHRFNLRVSIFSNIEKRGSSDEPVAEASSLLVVWKVESLLLVILDSWAALVPLALLLLQVMDLSRNFSMCF